MEKKQRRLLIAAGMLSSLAISSVSWAGVVPLENRLDAWEDYGTKAVYFDGVDINYQNGRTKKGITADTTFFGTGGNNFRLDSLTDGYDMFGLSDGEIIIDANISSRGTLRSGSAFGIYSNDAMFGGEPVVEYGCNSKGKNCSTGVLVYGGDLTAFGWSGSLGILEFEIQNFSGWASNAWGQKQGTTEHIYLDVDVFTLNDVSSVKAFKATADGFAVVPVPAAVWLFGSAILGLAGFARRNKRA